MKKVTMILMLFLLEIPCYVNAANDRVAISNRYICEALAKNGNTNNPQAILCCVNDMKRIAKFCPENWLASYYICIYDLRFVLYNTSSDYSNVLEEVNQKLTDLKAISGADLSEVSTLEGMYHLIFLSKHPENIGKRSYNKMLALFDHAIQLNPSNPRPMLLKFVAQYRMGKQLGFSIENEKQQCAKITELLTKEKQNYPYPSWGNELWKVLMNQ